MEVKKLSQILTLSCGILGGALLAPAPADAAPDPNFHVYIAYGQSNMAGAGDIRKGTDDKEHSRYKMFATTSCTRYPNVGEIYPAIPPMFHCGEGLSVADWFGRYLADSLPDVTVGVIPVAVGGTKIELFDKDKYASYLATAENWLVNWAKDYGSDGNAYARIVEVAKKAQEVGVIKGIIFHQGESGAMNGNNWQQEVKKSRDDILKALNLSSDTVPFLAGGLEDRAAGGCCWSFTDNNIKTLPNVMDNTYFVSSEGLKGNGKDSYHFSSESYQEFGRRYAEEMLKHISTVPVEPEPQTPFKGKAFDIPGKIEAEDFDVPGKGAGNDSYKENDTEDRGRSNYREGTGVDIYQKATGYVVGYNQEGEWLEYTVKVAEAGDYTMFAAVATDNATSAFQLSIDGEAITESVLASKADGEGSFDEFSKVKANVTLPAGEHILRMTVTSSWFDVDYFQFAKGKDVSDPDDPPDFVKPAFVSHATESESSFALLDLQGRVITVMQAKNMHEAVSKVKNSVTHDIVSGGLYFVVSNPGTKNQQMQKVVIYEK